MGLRSVSAKAAAVLERVEGKGARLTWKELADHVGTSEGEVERWVYEVLAMNAKGRALYIKSL